MEKVYDGGTNYMKKIVSLCLAFVMLITFTACSQNESPDNTINTTDTANSNTEETSSLNGNVLIAYFSVPETDGNDTVSEASRVVENDKIIGNTQYIAQQIQEETGGDLFAIETQQTYPESHDPLLEFAYEEKANNERPALSSTIENLDSYDIIFVGYPNWNADLPMPMYTFFEEHDFSGKTIIPFVTHGGSGFSGTIDTIAELQPNATIISNGLSISRNDVTTSSEEVTDWVNSLNINN